MKLFLIAIATGGLALSFGVFSQNLSPNQIEKLKAKNDISYEDLAHENKGCPENSICSAASGKAMKRWDKFLKSAQRHKDYTRKLESYRQKHGLPITFLAKKEASIGIDPIFFNSRCAHHNPKDRPKSKVFKGIQFFKNDPKSDSVLLGPARLYADEKPIDFGLPYEETPIMIKDKKLIVPRDHENIYYHLSIDQSGKWSVSRPASKLLSKAMQETEDIACPKDEKELPNQGLFLKTYCKKIWNADLEKAQTIKLAWACP